MKLYGKTPIVNSWYHQEARANGKGWNGNFLMTDVWVKKNKRWQVGYKINQLKIIGYYA